MLNLEASPILALLKWKKAVAITHSSETSTSGETHTISEEPLDASRISAGTAFGNIQEA